MSSCEQEDAANNSSYWDDESEIIRQLKDKFQETTVRSEKVKVLKQLYLNVGQSEELKFGASNYVVQKAKDLVKRKGIFHN